MCIYIHIYKSEGKIEILYDFIHTWNLKIQTKLKRNKLIKKTDQWSLKRKGVGKQTKVVKRFNSMVIDGN